MSVPVWRYTDLAGQIHYWEEPVVDTAQAGRWYSTDQEDERPGDQVRTYRIHDSTLRRLLEIATKDRETGWCEDIHESIRLGLVK